MKTGGPKINLRIKNVNSIAYSTRLAEDKF